MHLTSFSLDNFVSQELLQLTECQAREVADEFPDNQSWLSTFVLSRIIWIPLPKDKAALAFALIRRAEGAVTDYEEARKLLTNFISSDKNISLYFRYLRRFEEAVAMVYQALDFARNALNIKIFEQGDGSTYERLNLIYNKSRHSNPERLPAGHLHAVWIKNEGLFADGTHLTFDELHDLVRDVGRIADKLSKGQTDT